MNTIHDNQTKIREKTKAQFDKWYDEFKKFLSIQNLPLYHLDFYYSKEYCTSSCAHPEDPINDTHVIKINELLLPTHGQNAKPIAFHEFTHIYDSAHFYKLFGKHKHENLTTPYSEYHASQIQTICALGMESVSDNKMIRLSDRVYEGILTQSFTVQSYISYVNNNFVETIDYYFSTNCVQPINSRFINILRHITYYYGIIDTISLHLDNKSNMENKYAYLMNKIGDCIQVLHSKLVSFDPNMLHDYDDLYELWIQIGIKITKTLKSNVDQPI